VALGGRQRARVAGGVDQRAAALQQQRADALEVGLRADSVLVWFREG
jgi:hypothetical protein